MRDALYFRLRGWIPIPLYALMLLAYEPASPARWELALGLGLTVAGVLLRAWARMQIGRSSDTRRLHARRLITSGPYALVRNPLYVGNIGIACGLSVLIGAGAWTAALAAALGLHYDRVVRAEERMLEATFGEAYRSYLTHVRRWWPVPNGAMLPAAGTSGISADLWREWRIAALALIGAALSLGLRF